MNALAKEVFLGTWKSFKTFRKAGEVRQHNSNAHQEFIFEDADQLTIVYKKNGVAKKIADKNSWAITFKDKRHYLESKELNLKFEVITVNHTALVLQDATTNDKHFFARPEVWEHYMHAPSALNL